MDTFFIIVMMIVIGALIGGMTNSLAIKMLFRPFEPKFIGSFRVPFTPGLIPKRRNELAEQLGHMVVEHLITPAGLRRKFMDASFQKQMVDWAKEEVNRLLRSEQSLKAFLEDYDIPVDEQRVKTFVYQFTLKQYEVQMENRRHETLQSVLGAELTNKGKNHMHDVSTYMLTQLDAYISSAQGKQKLSGLVEQYLGGQGFLGNMVASFLGNEGIAEKIQPTLSKYINSSEAQQWLTSLLEEEYDKWIGKEVHYFESKIGASNIADWIATMVSTSLPIQGWMERSIADHMQVVRPYVVQTFVPKIIHHMGGYLADRIPEIMQKLHLSDIVKQEVQSFSVERLEEMVLSISKKEFKMITYLGALLGGLIGFVQSLIVLFLS
ncbi:DUF445 domain-containing protein [Pontibacillus litoralis]|uniref:Uncharacterized protein n=1 Tax=Pontibacillus litoralis JSM 072002 TaxID=1385512 RepID=A0A0A5FZR7_9BACI|nr:DUF445 family protein [Pontibacillus litoralis]KGX85289.1 hypothetical protein N784_09620 [Pontibacillus litoralis JSM 072002]